MGAAVMSAAAALPSLAFAQARNIPLAELMVPQALPDVWVGNPEAKVTIIEYASLTCSHCAAFHETTYKQLKTKYLDTGKARMSVREFPFDPLATAGFMLGRCQPAEKRAALIDLLFAQQRTWAFSEKPFEGLLSVVRQAGISQGDVESCLNDKDIYQKVSQVRDMGQQKFGVASTPTFFINGTALVGNQSMAEFEKIIEPLLR